MYNPKCRANKKIMRLVLKYAIKLNFLRVYVHFYGMPLYKRAE